VAEDWARPVVHWEIVARDPVRQAGFYRELFHWEIGDGPIMQVPPGFVTEPFDVPGGPTIAAVDDPEGNPLVLVQQ
jgi:predicted enzyme related to lactoylglutathione lyase